MTPHYPIELAGAQLWLLADKAIYYPALRVLMIADAHFGKAAAYRKLGQPVPRGTTHSNLQRIDALLERYPSEHLIFLGDFFHAPGSRAVATLGALNEWRLRHEALRIVLIRGNHDLRAGDPPVNWGFEVVSEPLLLGPFALQHEPDAHPTHTVLAGHVHPVYRLQGNGRQSLRLACFYIKERIAVLPAFGAFTGGMEIKPDVGSQIFIVGDGAVWRAL
ncbi:ligase-associated DNA damage response endonuclease PdeM [Pseudomonas sp. CCI3.2]|uniref:ligase-associated DNA damage response endonuclease PdeM n=1 Tax=unclassified Pseudomonas TaxID=196821 RepID=UPI002AC9C513|nr:MULTISPECIES: ligase-associated DNA damage response endonuclease PdeM [unclassified Pseudomonas]MEB0075716.1 ligase-associated DNA damage response endonuclease PdeM [Pseudomonas sp. MH10out]MEB0099807.1 ligase-associated DNA damage response endonuclease PdeM [Pseudomonas sp. CCI3.2]MEB0131009.1 ligase-associated DNA damage response endonuclease PdeM [Pseudomonas sp. CCI2.4]MEB0158221.1 ligase-associated DNA damage response endonuclease PdeM [Pseudomonas sp. AH2 (2023)]MEB0167312.1 ligase-as